MKMLKADIKYSERRVGPGNKDGGRSDKRKNKRL